MDSLLRTGEWEALAERTGAPPFLRPGWIEAWVCAFGGGEELLTVEVRRSTELVAVLPMLRRGGTLHSPSNSHTPMFGPVCVDDDARQELLGRLFDQPATIVDLNYLDERLVDSDAVIGTACREGRRVLTRVVARSPFISLEGTFEDYERDLSRNRRKALRRHRRRLEEEGSLQFEVHDGRSGLEQLLGEFFAVEASGWKGENGTAISSEAKTKGFYTDVARWAAERGWLRLAFLRLDGRPIAADLALEQAGVWYSLKAGYDEEFRSFGPGALLLRDEIADCCGRDVSRFELLGDEDSFKASWTDRHAERTWVCAFGGGPAGLLRWSRGATMERARPLLRRARSKLP